LSPQVLGSVLDQLPKSEHPDLLVGFDHNSDAGVYRIGERQALVQSVDFFTPIVDDPEDFGAIAAANALSDLYAMGARPITAMALVCFPDKILDPSVLVAILRGGTNKVKEAGAVVVGGHSVRDPELKYGLAVTGVVDPEQVRSNEQAQAGQVLVLTKPLGTGLIANCLKSGKVKESDEAVQVAVRSMRALNAAAAEVFGRHGVRAATDVTGFGLLGHARFMAEASGVGLRIQAEALPVFELALKLAEKPLAGGAKDNEDAASPYVDVAEGVSLPHLRAAFDAQTSGGLLGAVPADAVDAVIHELEVAGTSAAHVIGEVVADHPGRIQIV
jgi:selenide,water dikinase